MDQFVRVRLIQCNSIDLNLFQFDYDLTFAAFFLNADKTIYGRFGTRSSHDEASRDISIAGFRKAMEGALELHREYPENRAVLRDKTGPAAKFKVAHDMPSFSGRYTPFLDFQGKVAASCIHCHMLGEAVRLDVRKNAPNAPMPDPVIYPWPMPDVLGLGMDPDERSTIKQVETGSVAAQNGFRAGDEIESIEGQPLLSTADIQWILHQAKPPTTLDAVVRRGNNSVHLKLPLAENWRRTSDISWRTTSWDLRRIALGGLLLKPLSDAERQNGGLQSDQLGLRVQHVGQYGNHAVAKRAGFLKDDIIVAFDGINDNVGETELFAHILRQRRPGELVTVTVLRNGQRQEFRLKIQ